MSSSIWTRCAGASRIRPLRLTAWRGVESQHQISTRKLVDSAAEQEVLESMIDAAKPPDPTGGRMHYLLATPYRYPPLRHGSRFGSRHERAIWYGAESRETVLAEVAYYRFVFLEGTEADLGVLRSELTVFSVRARSASGLDLTRAPFDAHRSEIASPSRYRDSQTLGSAMRRAGVELFRYPSARHEGGIGVGAFVPDVFGRSQPGRMETWHCSASREMVEVRRRLRREMMLFPRARFLVRGRLPSPAL